MLDDETLEEVFATASAKGPAIGTEGVEDDSDGWGATTVEAAERDISDGLGASPGTKGTPLSSTLIT